MLVEHLVAIYSVCSRHALGGISTGLGMSESPYLVSLVFHVGLPDLQVSKVTY